MNRPFIALSAVLALAISGCDKDDDSAQPVQHVEPERLNVRADAADQASQRTPAPEQLGNTADKGMQKSEVPFLIHLGKVGDEKNKDCNCVKQVEPKAESH